MSEVTKMTITEIPSQFLSAFSQSHTCVLNHHQPYGSTNNNGIENIKNAISGKHA